MSYKLHDPDAVLEYTADFSGALDVGCAIDEIVAVEAEGLTLGTGSREPTYDDTSVTFWVIAAVAGKATVTVRVRDDNDPARTLNDLTCVFFIVDS